MSSSLRHVRHERGDCVGEDFMYIGPEINGILYI
jgi:hypothetical protein